VDPMFGTLDEFRAFTKELERRGMHLILDAVFNHVGDDSIYFDRYESTPNREHMNSGHVYTTS